jgi:hypothetical protein
VFSLPSKPRPLIGLLCISVALVLAGCGGQPAPAATESAVSPAAVTSAPASPSAVTPEATISAEDPTAEATEVASEGASDKPPVLDKNATGRDLTTGDFFRTPDEWRDGRFNVAGKQAVAGVAGPLDDCEEQASDYSPTIELRLANNFSRVSMKIGQSDDSESSDAIVYVNVLGNGKYLDSTQVAFNKIQLLDAPIADVNALKIQVWRGGDRCTTSNSTEAVLTELRVE